MTVRVDGVKEHIRQLVHKLGEMDESMTWVKCPICHIEWLKLRPCVYFTDGQRIVTYACLNCTEGVQSIEQIKGMVPGVEVRISLYPAYRVLPPEFRSRTSYYATLSYGDWVFTVEPKAGGAPLVVQDRGEKKFFDNIYQVMAYIKDTLVKGEPKEIGWGAA